MRKKASSKYPSKSAASKKAKPSSVIVDQLPEAGDQAPTAKILSGDRRALAKAITLVESGLAAHRKQAESLIESLLPHTGNSLRIGISGTPGVGKSTFIESFGQMLVAAGHRVGVLAVDPSSPGQGGAILGDKTRMPELAKFSEVYIRPSAAGKSLGGVTRRTRESILLCEAAGFDIILIETVGVGQSELAVSKMSDVFVVLLAPAGGDELQGIKRGIMEMADIVVVTKADSDLRASAGRAAAAYKSALRYLHPALLEWKIPVLLVSAQEHTGLEAVWEQIQRFQALLQEKGLLEGKRRQQNEEWFHEEIELALLDAIRGHPHLEAQLSLLEKQIRQGKSLPPRAARQVVEDILSNHLTKP